MWQLIFHPEKCKYMEITRKDKERNPSYKLNRIEVKRTEEEKDLGILMDKKLSFENHMAEKINKAKKII